MRRCLSNHSPHCAGHSGAHAKPTGVEDLHGHLEPIALTTENIFHRHLRVVKVQLGCVAAMESHLLLGWPAGDAAERALRAVALGRKNWLFAGSDEGGERAAAIYSLLGTAKLNGLNPEGYLRYVLERIADHPINRIEELLTWNVVAQLPSLRLAA